MVGMKNWYNLALFLYPITCKYWTPAVSKFIYTDEDMRDLHYYHQVSQPKHDTSPNQTSVMKLVFENRSTILDSIDKCAADLANNFNLCVNQARYRIVDFEFYLFTEQDHFQDPHTYRHDLQREHLKIYVHGSGLDITLGDGKNHVGMLIRSIIKLYDGSDQTTGFMKYQIDGPQLVATEILSNLHPLDSQEPNTIELQRIKYHQDACFYPATQVLKTKRVGLTPKPTDTEDFFLHVPLRYIAIVPHFKQKIKGIEQIVEAYRKRGEMDDNQVEEILGYKKKFA